MTGAQAAVIIDLLYVIAALTGLIAMCLGWILGNQLGRSRGERAAEEAARERVLRQFAPPGKRQQRADTDD